MSFKSLLWVIGIILIAIFVVATFFLVGISDRKAGLDVSIQVPHQILTGAPFEVVVSVGNNSNSLLKETRVLVELPEKFVFVGTGTGLNRETRELGNLGVGSLTKETFSVLALGGENTIKNIKALVSYAPTAASSRFEKTASARFEVGVPAARLDISTPQKVFSGEGFEITVTYKSIADIIFEDTKLRMQYPSNFTVTDTSLEAESGDSLWDLGSLQKNSEGELIIKGFLVGQENAEVDFEIVLESEFFGNHHPINTKTARVKIAQAPFSLSITLDDDPNALARAGSSLKYIIRYTNNTNIGLKDVVLTARLIGAMFDLSRIRSEGFLRSVDNTVVWTAASIPQLALIPAGASGEAEVTISTNDEFPIKRLSDKNFTIKVEGRIESTTVPDFIATDKTFGIADIETKVVGAIEVDAFGLFRDAASGIINSGPLPMIVNQPTQFTIHWLVTSKSTELRDVELKAFLGPNVRFTGVTKSNSETIPELNNRTQQVVWKIPRVPANKGVLDAPYEATFQVEILPAIPQLGTIPMLVDKMQIRAVDDFTGVTLSDDLSKITTRLNRDPTVDKDAGRVIQ
jgi:hypothetical protein